jgi:hypothetical protein
MAVGDFANADPAPLQRVRSRFAGLPYNTAPPRRFLERRYRRFSAITPLGMLGFGGGSGCTFGCRPMIVS